MQRFRMSSRRRTMPPGAAIRSLAFGAALAIAQLAALGCSESANDPGSTPNPLAAGPRYGHGQTGGTIDLAALVSAGIHSCMGDDALASGVTSGMKAADDLNCSSSDITLDQFLLVAYSFDGTNFVPFSGPISCTSGQTVYVQAAANLAQNANAPRTDIGLWLAVDGGNAVTGQCQQYTLNSAAPGVVNFDGDLCGDLASGTSTVIPLGVLPLTCSNDGSGFVHVGTCVAWKGSGDTICPTQNNDLGYRYGSVPSNKSKCNCSGFDVPISVL